MAAARCSDSQLLPVPGSPTSSRARSEASVTMARSTMASSPKNLRVIGTSTALAVDLRLERLAADDVSRARQRGDSRHGLGGVSGSFCRSASS